MYHNVKPLCKSIAPGAGRRARRCRGWGGARRETLKGAVAKEETVHFEPETRTCVPKSGSTDVAEQRSVKSEIPHKYLVVCERSARQEEAAAAHKTRG